MIALEVGDLFGLIMMVYLVCHLPAIITLIIGFTKMKKKPETAKKLFIFSAIYFIIGGGICGSMFM